MAKIKSMSDHTPSDTVRQFHEYLSNRAIPIASDYLNAAGIELAGATRMADYLGFIPYSSSGKPPSGVLFKYPGSDYGTVKILGHSATALCPRGKPVHAYLPRSTDWPNVEGELILCESVLKALTWARAGFNALAASGVDTLYMGIKQRWCEDFPHDAIDSGAITAIRIAFDNDIRPEINKNVARAVRTLSGALAERHPNTPVTLHELPDPPAEWQAQQGKAIWGCDDACKYYGDAWFAQFAGDPQYAKAPPVDEMQEHLDYYTCSYILCLHPVGVYHRRTGNFFKKSDFTGTAEARRFILGGKEPVPTAPIWWAHPATPLVHGKTYEPGQDIIVGEGEDAKYNVWRPSPVIPSKGDVTRWLDLLDDAIQDKVTLNLMLGCMAYQVQNRGVRLPKLLYFVGREVGTGKSTQIAIMRKILGDANVGQIDKTLMEDRFNDCWAAKELATLDDVEKLGAGSWSKLRTHITSESTTVTERNVNPRPQKNYTVFYISANQADILTTDVEERRVLMIHFQPSVLHRDSKDTYWDSFYRWLEKEGGVEAIAHYLGTYDLSEFDPHFHPPLSGIKREAMESTRDEQEDFILRLIDDPLDYLPAERVAVTNRELHILMTGEAYQTFHAGAVREMCKMIGAKMLLVRASPKQVRIGGAMVTLYYVPGKGASAGKQFSNPKDRVRWLRENIINNELNVLQRV